MSIPVLSARDKEIEFALDKNIAIVKDDDDQLFIRASHVPSQSWVEVPIQTSEEEKEVDGLSPKDLVYAAYLSIYNKEKVLVHPENQVIIKKLEEVLKIM